MTCHAPRPSHLPLRQRQLLEFIDATLRTEKRFPRVAEMRDFMGWKNDTSVYDCLDRLRWRGYVRRVNWPQSHSREYERVAMPEAAA